MPNDAIIYHNPCCSKSRQALKLLEENQIGVTIIHYIDTPPNTQTLIQLLDILGIDNPRNLMRKHEPAYKENQLDNLCLTDQELIAYMVKHPSLIERPIVIKGHQAIIARPPEKVLTLR